MWSVSVPAGFLAIHAYTPLSSGATLRIRNAPDACWVNFLLFEENTACPFFVHAMCGMGDPLTSHGMSTV